MKLRVATCMTLPEPDADETPLMAALAGAGIEAKLVAWDDPAADWDAPVPTIIRSTWNYPLHVEAFKTWAERAARAAPLLNPAEIVKANVHKRYLLDLEARRVAVVPTRLIADSEAAAKLERWSRACPANPGVRVVIKPEVGAGSLRTKTFLLPRETEAAALHLRGLLRFGAALVQPYLASVDSHGERSLIWIEGDFTHSIRKSPRFAGDVERVDGPLPIDEAERRLATAALEPYADRILYARVDMARDDAGEPMIMELELVEPSLFFPKHPPALDRYIAGLKRRLSW